MLKASSLFYNKLRADVESIGFEINPYNPCVIVWSTVYDIQLHGMWT